MRPANDVTELDFNRAWRRCPYRSVFANVSPTAPMPPIGAAVFVYSDPATITSADVSAWATLVEQEAERGCCFVIMSMSRAARDAAKAAVAAELNRRHSERIGRCGTTSAPWAQCKR